MADFNVISALQNVSRELESQLESAGIQAEKREEIIDAIEAKLSPAITNLEQLSEALRSDIFSPEGSSGSSGRVAKAQAIAVISKFIGASDPNTYIDPKTGKVRTHIFA